MTRGHEGLFFMKSDISFGFLWFWLERSFLTYDKTTDQIVSEIMQFRQSNFLLQALSS